MTATGVLTESDVVAVRAEVASAKAVTVWFTAAAVGVPVGGSAKVVAVGDAAVDEFIQVRPAGSRDTMFCSPHELTRVRPPRRRAGRAPEPAETPARAVTTPRAQAPTPQAPTPRAPSVRAPAPRAAATTPTAAEQAPASEQAAPAVAPAAPARAARSARSAAPRRGGDRAGEITIGLTATAEGEWSVEVRVGRKQVVGSTPVSAADVAAAARSLPPQVAEVVESSVEGARRRQHERVERLRAELDSAQRMLDRLGT